MGRLKESEQFSGSKGASSNCHANAQQQEKPMFMTKCFLQNHVLISILLVIALRPVAMKAASESDRLERLERAVEQLQMRNAELETEVRSLKQQTAAVPDGKFKTKVNYDGKTYVEQAVPAPEKPPLFVQQRGPELKLVLGWIRSDQL
jgi:hypothetical protein